MVFRICNIENYVLQWNIIMEEIRRGTAMANNSPQRSFRSATDYIRLVRPRLCPTRTWSIDGSCDA
jgi:hypothetical protein